MIDIMPVLDVRAELGEGTLWDPVAEVLWWVDIWGKAIHRYDPATRPRRCLPDAGICRLRSASASRAAWSWPWRTASTSLIRRPACSRRSSIPRPTGRTRASMTASPTGRAGSGRARSSRTRRARPNMSGRSTASTRTSPATAWSTASARPTASPSAPTAGRCISPTARAASSGPGTSTRRAATSTGVASSSTSATTGGMRRRRHRRRRGLLLDDAARDRPKSARYDPDGRLMRTIDMPTAIPTCCEFGGRDLDVLYVTSAKLRKLTDPLAGALFAIDVGVKGADRCPTSRAEAVRRSWAGRWSRARRDEAPQGGRCPTPVRRRRRGAACARRPRPFGSPACRRW